MSIIVKTTFVAEHYWDKAPNEVKFLREKHPHTFFVEAEIEVFKTDRQLEFFMVKRYLDAFIEQTFAYRCFSLSCEQIAEKICGAIKHKYGKRYYSIKVFEDNVNGGRFVKEVKNE